MKSTTRKGSRCAPRTFTLRGKLHRCAVETLEKRQLFAGQFGLTDSTFGVLGHAVATNSAADGYSPTQIAIDSNGDIYEGSDGGIARFKPSGAVDKTFGTKGIAAIAGGAYVAAAVAPNGLVYALVTTGSGSVLIRYTASGVLDTSYDEAGTAQVTSDTSFTPTTITVQVDNKVLVSGTESTDSGSGAEMEVFRLNTDGSADSAFGTNGVFQANLGSSTFLTPTIVDRVVGISALSNGDILVGGGSADYDTSSDALGNAVFAVAGLTSSGTLDSSYGSGGISRDTYLTAAQFTAGDALGFDEQSVAAFLPTAFAVSASGSAVVGASSLGSIIGEQAASFDASGNVVYTASVTPDGLTNGTVVGATILGDGRAVLLADSQLGSNTGFAMTPISTNGVPGDTVLTDDLNPSTLDINGGYNAGIAVASNGQLLVGGIPTAEDGYEVQQFDIGSATATRGDNIVGGSTNALNYAVNGSLNVAYYNSASRDLQFVQRLRNGLWSTPITVDHNKGAGEYLSIAADPTKGSTIEIAYYSKKTKSLDLATSTNRGATFSDQIIDGSGNDGQFPSIYINGHNLADIAYYDDTTHSLRLATQNKKLKFAISTIDATGDVGRDAILTPAPSGRLSVAYVDSTTGQIKWAAQNSDGSWTAKVAATAKKGAQGLTMDYGGEDDPAIAYYDVAHGNLDIAAFTTANGGFTNTTVATGLGQYTGLSLPNFESDPTVYAYDAAANNVQLFSNPVDAPGDGSTIVTGGGNYLQVADTVSGVALTAYLDTASGDLVVRPVPES